MRRAPGATRPMIPVTPASRFSSESSGDVPTVARSWIAGVAFRRHGQAIAPTRSSGGSASHERTVHLSWQIRHR